MELTRLFNEVNNANYYSIILDIINGVLITSLKKENLFVALADFNVANTPNKTDFKLLII